MNEVLEVVDPTARPTTPPAPPAANPPAPAAPPTPVAPPTPPTPAAAITPAPAATPPVPETKSNPPRHMEFFNTDLVKGPSEFGLREVVAGVASWLVTGFLATYLYRQYKSAGPQFANRDVVNHLLRIISEPVIGIFTGSLLYVVGGKWLHVVEENDARTWVTTSFLRAGIDTADTAFGYIKGAPKEPTSELDIYLGLGNILDGLGNSVVPTPKEEELKGANDLEPVNDVVAGAEELEPASDLGNYESSAPSENPEGEEFSGADDMVPALDILG